MVGNASTFSDSEQFVAAVDAICAAATSNADAAVSDLIRKDRDFARAYAEGALEARRTSILAQLAVLNAQITQFRAIRPPHELREKWERFIAVAGQTYADLELAVSAAADQQDLSERTHQIAASATSAAAVSLARELGLSDCFAPGR